MKNMELVLASSNPGKLKEFSYLFADLPIRLKSQTELGVDDIEETGLTFVENAILKARNAADKTGLPALADDSGLVVDALEGRPGIYSARYAGINANPNDNIKKLLEEAKDIPQSKRQARFVCVLVMFHFPQDPYPIICQASWEGELLFSAQGENGFGYDPIFWVPTHQCSAAELTDTIKNQISHRAKALRILLYGLKGLA
jgi:XTP/dITP diphosphohydrolase